MDLEAKSKKAENEQIIKTLENETMKKLFTIALVISASISLHAQQPKKVVKFVFQTDKSGSILDESQKLKN